MDDMRQVHNVLVQPRSLSVTLNTVKIFTLKCWFAEINTKLSERKNGLSVANGQREMKR